MKNRLLYNTLFVVVATLLLSFVVNNNESDYFETSTVEVDECYIPLFFATDDNNNPYDYDVLDDYFVGRLSAHHSNPVLKYLLPSYVFVVHLPHVYTSKSVEVVYNLLLLWYANSHSRAPTC